MTRSFCMCLDSKREWGYILWAQPMANAYIFVGSLTTTTLSFLPREKKKPRSFLPILYLLILYHQNWESIKILSIRIIADDHLVPNFTTITSMFLKMAILRLHILHFWRRNMVKYIEKFWQNRCKVILKSELDYKCHKMKVPC